MDIDMKHSLRWLFLGLVLVLEVGMVQATDVTSLLSDGKLEKKAELLRKKATGCYNDLQVLKSYADLLNPAIAKEMPVGICQSLGTASVTVAFSDRTDSLEYSFFSVFCKIDIPQGQTLFFGAEHVKYTRSGRLVGDARLALLADVPIPFGQNGFQVIVKGGINSQTGQMGDQTYAKLTCKGVSEVALSADVVFPRSMLVPLKQNLEVDSAKQVTASFKTVITDWNDILAEISLPNFAVKGLEKFAFTVDKAVVDLSDTRNSADVSIEL
jgi:hypothetical protein